MRICVLDLGGMSFHLLHARVLGTGELIDLGSTRLPTRLGRKTIHTGFLDSQSFSAGLADLGHLAEEARMLAPERIVVVATSAIRAASNAHAFIAKAREIFDLDVSVLSSRKEAELSYRGAVSEAPGSKGSMAVIDLGGGSCEVALGEGSLYETSHSAEIGVLPLREAFQIEDSIGPIKTGAIAEVVRMALRPMQKLMSKGPPDRVIFASGTARAVASLARTVLGDGVPAGQISLAQIAMLRRFVFNRSPAEFLTLGVDPHRADVIAIAVIAMEHVMSSLHCLQAEVSSRGLREGVALCEWERIQAGQGRNSDWHVLPPGGDGETESLDLAARRYNAQGG